MVNVSQGMSFKTIIMMWWLEFSQREVTFICEKVCERHGLAMASNTSKNGITVCSIQISCAQKYCLVFTSRQSRWWCYCSWVDMWANYILHSIFLRILIKFIVSKESCPIPPEFRVDPYKCEESSIKDIGTDISWSFVFLMHAIKGICLGRECSLTPLTLIP